MRIVNVPTFEAKIYIGCKEGYNGETFCHNDLHRVIADFQRDTDADLTTTVRITETTYLFGFYEERGWEICVINYPRFPKSTDVLRGFAVKLAQTLLEKFKQNRISIVFEHDTVMLESDDAEERHT